MSEKITRQEFESVFYRDYTGLCHYGLCITFSELAINKEWNNYWHEINTENCHYIYQYFGECCTKEELALLRLMVAIEFMEANNLLED